ncbi:unnamed protein product (macronuclear) [Paramecium tetraurelia]|uniref:Protein kinase domain-containing protein n=1 Tax=Paramecium tetraurelia TaxID=5888 RepID=A0DUN6_PARTE|nr:uncharacterized protein GSPATT00020425001 [Paramecium tetraurelia]CAK86753.1 unnamed protein product [Paramecium tetraurelia]|eukprot:XP_001454150.1 hypothetical protein (macronuclear) [Paramecium tetraurelia strain d4-2]
MKGNHPYTITFPIWQCEQWSALKGRLKLTDEQVVIARWNDTRFLDEELAFLESYHRIKPHAETKLLKPQISLLPSILQIVRTNTYTDLIIENVSQWLLINGDLSKLLLIYFGYDLYQGCSPRDCTIENIVKNGDSIVILDFGLKKRQENYCVYWNPLILKGKPCRSSYQWSLGILYLVMTQGTYILNEVHRHIADWLQGGRLDIGSLISNKKPTIQNLISSLLNPENPIPWHQIPYHSAFREDNACKQILKDFQIRLNRMEVKCRSSSRISSRDDSNSLINLPQQPQYNKNPKLTEQNLLNQSLITKISNMQKMHQENVRSVVGNRYSSVQSRQKSSSHQSRQMIQTYSSNKFNNFFSSTKLLPKPQIKSQNNSHTGVKSFRNQTQNTTIYTGYDSSRKINDNSQELMHQQGSQQNISQSFTKNEFFYDKIRARISSVQGNTIKMSTKQRFGSSSQNSKSDQSKQQQVVYTKGSKTQEELQQMYQQSENAMEQYKAIYSSDLEDNQQQRPNLDESRISNAENYIQLIKRSSQQLSLFSQKYNRSLDALNIIGQTVAKCLTFFNGLQNFWVIPLFLVFKRMLQLRKEIEILLESKINSFGLDEWDYITSCFEFENYCNKVKQDNQLVQNELNLLLNTAKAKAEKLDKNRKDKVEWFLNDFVDDDIKDICFTYFHGQIYQNIKEKKGVPKSTLEWLRLQIQAQASLIIFQLPVLMCDKENFTYEGYLQALEFTDENQILQYLKRNEQYLESK